jgi:ATP-dependent Lon protease
VKKQASKIDIQDEDSLVNEVSLKSFMKGFDLHVHFPTAAKKDGPSAGITVTTCLVSLFSN